MKLICAFCGFRNKSEAPNCAQCGNTLADARHERFRLPWASWLPAIPIALFLQWQQSNSNQIADNLAKSKASNEAAHRAELQQLETTFVQIESGKEAKHQALLRDPEFLSGRKAAERHAAEWARRQNHDPAFINSIAEQTLVEVERLGKDPALNAETSLKRVAEKVCPYGSRIEITPTGNRFNIRVAFRLSSVAPNEAGNITLHTSTTEMRRQVEEATARLMQALFDYCGSRGIERISVSCNRALVEGESGAEALRMRSLYRASINSTKAGQVANWRTLPLAQIKQLLTVEHDMLSRITFQTSRMGSLALDPNEPLEF